MKDKQVKKGKQSKDELPKLREKRCHNIAFKMNDTEYKAVQRHLKKYGITNKSNWYRRTILAHIWQKLGEDLPMLFDEKDMQQAKKSYSAVPVEEQMAEVQIVKEKTCPLFPTNIL